MEHTWPLRYSVVFQTRLWKNRGARGQSITALACSYKAFSLCGQPPCLPQSQHTAREDRSGEEDLPLEGALGCLCEPSAPPFLWQQGSLPAHWPGGRGEGGGGDTDVTGARQRGRRPAKGEYFTHVVCFFFKLKRASNNIQKKGPAGLPAGRCRCASQADEGLVSKLHLFSSLRGVLHCLLWHSLFLLTSSFVGAEFLPHRSLCGNTCSHRLCRHVDFIIGVKISLHCPCLKLMVWA